MLGIGGWDWITLGIYLVGVTAIGVWTARKVKDTADFFIGGRRFGKAFMLFFAFGAGTNGNQAVGVASKTYSNGMSGIWYQLLWLFSTPFYWLIAPVFRRMRAITTGDFFQYRYGGYTDALYAVVGPLQLVVNIGVMLKGSGAVIEAISGHAINQNIAILVMTVLFVVYGVAGGLSAAIVTDFIQGILTVLLSFMLIPFALQAVHGFAGLHDKISDPAMFSLVAPGEINLFHIVMMSVNALVGIVVQPHIMGVCAGGRTEMDGRVGFGAGNLLKRICTVAWMLTGLCAVVMYSNLKGGEVDLVYGKMARDLLPGILPGLVGIFLASLLASVMSSCDAFMVSSSGLFTQNLYRRYIVRHKEDKHYVLVGRITSVLLVAGSLVFAYTIEDVPTGLEIFWKVAAMMGAGFWVGLYWRRATPHAVWASTLVAFALIVTTSTGSFNNWAVEHLPDYMIWDGKFRVSFQMFVYLTAAFGTCIGVSLITPRVPNEQLERFYACLRTPVGSDEPHLEPFSLPEGVEPGPARKLIDHPDLEIPVPTLIGMGGFIFFWGCVAGMIGSIYWMSTWGS
ncbi:MAG TPA: sodium:solute symporter family protein [Candidatus Hydrogenedentes bacterium]|nr:sodium:solute symporter family protein [Candidatus Hydrogenedentota bacterium]